MEGLFALANQIEERLQKAKAHVDKLTLSLLACVSRCQLVTHDPMTNRQKDCWRVFVKTRDVAIVDDRKEEKSDESRRFVLHILGEGAHVSVQVDAI